MDFGSLAQTSDEEIYDMLLLGELTNIQCPYCQGTQTMSPELETAVCDLCGNEYKNPLNDPKLIKG